MDKILSINTIKNVFAALGAKTSDSNYGVALLDKTTAEPKGLMGMSDLASVLGVKIGQIGDNGDLNNYVDRGTWSVSGSNISNCPMGSDVWVGGILIVERGTYKTFEQRFVRTVADSSYYECWVRAKWDIYPWTAWKKITIES